MITYSNMKRNIIDVPIIFNLNNQVINELDSIIVRKIGFGFEIITGYGLVLKVYGYVWFFRFFMFRFDIIPGKGDRGKIDGLFFDWDDNSSNDLARLRSGQQSNNLNEVYDSYK